MLKHATPRSSPSLVNTPPRESPKASVEASSTEGKSIPSSHSSLPNGGTIQTPRKPYNERSIDCEGIVAPSVPSGRKETNTLSVGLSLGGFIGEKILSLGSLSGTGNGIGPVITHGKAIVRRGLSFNTKTESDTVSVRSVKSEGHAAYRNNVIQRQQQQLLPKAKSALIIPTRIESGKNEKEEEKTGGKEETNVHVPQKSDEANTKDKQNNVKPSSSSSKSSSSSTKSSYKKIFGVSKHDHPSLKSLLRLPGVYGHIPVPENAPFGTPHILSPDSLSLNSSVSFISSNSGRTSSRSWSSNASSNSNNTSDSSTSNCSSTSEPASTTLKVFAKCLRSDIEYKTVSIGSKVTCRELINLLLSKAKMKHRDPNLFYLTMEVTVRRWSGVPVRALLVLEESAKPAQLALCRPSGDLKFVLQMRKGGIIKVHDTVLMPGSQYKSLLISYRTTAEDAVQLLLNCYGRKESKNFYALHELCQFPDYKDRLLDQRERPLEVKAEWPKDRRAEYVFVMRRNMTQALSLRKLTLRTLEKNTSKGEEKTETSISKEDKKPYENEKPKVEETLIDCTSTIPVMKTLVRKETEPSNNLQCARNINPIPRTSNTNAPFLKSQPGHTQQRSSSENRNDSSDIISDLFSNRWQNSSCRVSFHSFPKGQMNRNVSFPMYNKTNEATESLRPPNCLNTIKNHVITPSGNAAPRNGVIQNNTIRSDFILAKATRYDVTPSNESRNDVNFSNLSTQNVNTSRNNPISANTLKAEVSSISKNYAMSATSKVIVHTSQNTKVLSSSAVQTELTCIPVKGTKPRYKWNSVETLLDTHYKPYVGVASREKTQNIFSKMLKNAETNSLITESHPPDTNCNRQNCFYI